MAKNVMRLRPYQEDAKREVEKNWAEGNRRQLVSLPTGCGKTIVFAHIINDVTNSGGRTLVLAHRNRLLTQAADKLKVACDVDSFFEKGSISAAEEIPSPPVVVSSIQTMSKPYRLETFPRDFFTHIVVDEAHHCLADTYQTVLNYFDSANVLGVTATPSRSDKRSLATFFDQMAYQYSMVEAVDDGWLSKLKVKIIPLKLDISKAAIQNGDYSAGDIGTAIDPYLEEIAIKLKEYAKDRKTVVFLPLIETAKRMQSLLRKHGITAKEIDGTSKNPDKILEDFEKGKYQVLCNAMLLTEGWDCPSVDCVVNLRATKSLPLFQQIVGRGMRLAPGKEHLLILDFLWQTARLDLCTPASLISEDEDMQRDLNKRLQKGEEVDLFEAKQALEEERAAAWLRTLAGQLEEGSRHGERVIVFNPLSFAAAIFSSELLDYKPIFSWEYKEPSQQQLNALQKFGIDTETVDTRGYASKLLDALCKRADQKKASVRQMAQLQLMGYDKVSQFSFKQAAEVIGKREPATEKQLGLLRRNGYNYTADQISKTDASKLIGDIIGGRIDPSMSKATNIEK